MSDRPPDPLPSVSRQRLAPIATANVLMGMFSRVSGLFAGLILTPLVLAGLGAQRYGLLAAAISTFEVLILLRGGFGASLRRYVTLHRQAGEAGEARRHYAVGFWWANLAHAAMLLLAVGLAGSFARFVRLPETFLADGTRGLALLSLAWVIDQVGSIFEVPIYAGGRLTAMQSVSATVPWIRLFAVIGFFAARGASLTSYASATLLAEASGAASLAVLAGRARTVGPVIPRFDLGDPPIRRSMLSYGGWALLLQIASLVTASGPALLAGRLFGPEPVTRYSLGARWEPLLRSLIATPIATLAPLFTQLEATREEERSRQAVRRAVTWAATLAVPACLVPCVVGDLFLARWVGETYRSSSVYLIATLLPTTLAIATAPVWAALTGRGRIARLAMGDLLLASAGLLLGTGLAMTDAGLLGFAIGVGLAILAKAAFLVPMTAARHRVIARKRDVWVPLGRALLGALPGLLILFALRDFYARSLPVVVLAGGLGGMAALAGSAATTLGWGEVRNLWRSLTLEVRPQGPVQ